MILLCCAVKPAVDVQSLLRAAAEAQQSQQWQAVLSIVHHMFSSPETLALTFLSPATSPVSLYLLTHLSTEFCIVLLPYDNVDKATCWSAVTSTARSEQVANRAGLQVFEVCITQLTCCETLQP